MVIKTKLTRFIGVASAAVCLVSGVNFVPFTLEIEAADVMTAFEITENMQFGWNLGNTFDAYVSVQEKGEDGSIKVTYPENLGLETETAWNNPETTKEMIHAVKAKGFNTIRVPVTWFQHVDKNNNYKIDDAWMARVKQVVDWCIEEDLYVILNMHHEEGWQNSSTLGQDYERIKPFVTSVWTQIAETFKDYDQHLVFESMNEPRAVGTTYEWWAATAPQAECDVINKLNADVVNIVRSTKSDYNEVRLIMLPSYCASSDPTFMNANVIPEGDSYLAASVHAYTPYNFTMNDEIKDHSKFTASYKNELVNCLETVKATFIDKNIPVVIGEFSSSNYGNIDARVDWATTYATTVKAAGIPVVLWDNNVIENKTQPGESHGYLNRSNCTWYEQSVAVIDTILDVFNDPTTVWGKEPEKEHVDHADISTGTVLYTGPTEIDKKWGDEAHNYQDSIGLTIDWAKQLDGKDVAVKYTGSTLAAAVSDENWGGWTEVKPYDVDEEKGIAYFSMDDLKEAWGEDASTIAHFSVRTDDNSTIELIAAIEAASHENTDKTKKYNINLANRGEGESLVITFEGKAGSAIEGAVGYMGAEEWQQVEYKGTIGADGKYVLEVAYGENGIPAGIATAQAQIWWCDDEDAKMASYVFTSEAIVPTEPTTSEQPTEPITSEPPTSEPPTDPITSEPPTDPTTTGDVLYGDANCDGKVSIADSTAILQHLGNEDKYSLKPQGKINGDCDGEAGITGNDAITIQLVDARILTADQLPLKK